ncbi:MAG: sulfotransferase [Thermodesulfobacteriota bacterium]
MTNHPAILSQRPIFIGGTGRCGTSILAQCLALHPDLLYFPEPSFLAGPQGIADLLAGRTPPAEFMRAMLGGFLPRLVKNLVDAGSREAGAAYSAQVVIHLFTATFGRGLPLIEASALFTDRLFTLGQKAAGKSRWMEKTPHTIVMADKLYRMFPDLLYIHLLRSPRDVCASILEQNWGPASVEEFVRYYNQLMRTAFHAQQSLPPSQYLCLDLETLVHHPEPVLSAVMRAGDLDHDQELVSRMASLVDHQRANIGRHRSSLTEEEKELVDRACRPLYDLWRQRAGHTSGLTVEGMNQPEPERPWNYPS